MGIHYVNGDYLKDDVLDIARPEAVMYEPMPDGSLALVAVEYITFKGPASLQGHLFNFIGAPNRYGLDPFYELHVWAWKPNPAGTFADMNPDVSCDAVSLARRNLELTSPQGLARRLEELRQMGAHPSRIASAERLMDRIEGRAVEIEARVADITDKDTLEGLNHFTADIVLTDLPYGSQTHWQTASERPLVSMLDVLWDVLPPHAVIVVAATERRAFDDAPRAYRTLKHGRRTIKMFRQPQTLDRASAEN
jgi:hypothetical protein